VIKIRYADLPGGLHIRVAASGRDTIIYLLPGLTTVQRRAALRRARSSARMGQGPGLPTAGVAAAMMADGIRTTLRNVAGAMRGHPAIFVPPIVIMGVAAIAYVLLVSVTIRVHPPQAGGSGNGFTSPIAQGVAPPPQNPPQNLPQHQATHPAAAAPTGSRPQSPRPSVASHHRTGGSPSPSPSATSPSPSPGSTPPLQPAPPDSSAPPPSPSPAAGAAGAAGTSGWSGSKLCIDIGPLGACLSM
jgi:hypothetical protein